MTIKVLIVDGDHNMHHFYQMVFEDFNNTIEIIEAPDGEHAISLFTDNDEFSPDFIISDYVLDDQQGIKFYQYLRHRYSEIPFVVVTKELNSPYASEEEFQRKETNHIIIKPAIIKELRAILSLYFDGEKEKISEDISGDYQKINTIFFMRFQKTLCDVYIKLSEKKFIKVIHGDTGFEAADIQKYINKGMEYLYLTNEDFESFKVSISSLTFLENLEKESSKDCSFATTLAVMSGLMQTYGFTETILKKGLNQISTTRDFVLNSKELINIFDIRQNKENFYSDHALLVSLLSCMTLEKLNWSSKENTNKLCLAAILHDSTLPDNIVNIMESGNVDQLQFISDEENEQFHSHPLITGELIRTKTSLHSEIATIIEEHHEKSDGSGFPKKLTHHNIHPFSSLFIIIHDFVEQIYITRFDSKLNEAIIEEMTLKYTEGHFLTAFTAFKELFNKIDKKSEDATTI